MIQFYILTKIKQANYFFMRGVITEDDSSRAKVFKDTIRRAVYKASPLPSAPDESVFDKELMITFSVN